MSLAEELQALAPFGMGNPAVSLMVQDARFADPRPMGEGRHVRFTVQSRGARARAVAFGSGPRLPVAEDEAAEATFTLEVNEFNGVSEPRLVLRQARPAAGQAQPAARVEPAPQEEPQSRGSRSPRRSSCCSRCPEGRPAGRRVRPRGVSPWARSARDAPTRRGASWPGLLRGPAPLPCRHGDRT